MEATEYEVEVRKKGGCLTLWIIFAMLGTGVSALSYFLTTGTLAETYDKGESLFYVLGVLAFIQFLGVVGIVLWQRWGAYLYVGVAVLSIGFNLYLGIILQGLGGFIVGMLLMYVAINEKWKFFE